MKTLPMKKESGGDKASVECQDKEISVHRYCGYCRHCTGIRVGRRVIPVPQGRAVSEIRKGTAPDENLMQAAMMFNTYVRDGSDIECDDDANEGYRSRYGS
jgi:hypothetical protein